jgi:hypothetical protein
MKIDKIILMIKENMIVGSGGFTGSSPAEGPTAGFDPLLKFKNKKKGKNIDFRRVPKNYKSWVKSVKNK